MKNVLILIAAVILMSCAQNKAENENKTQERKTVPAVKQPPVEVQQPKKEEIIPIGKGKITTIVDGFDVRQVKLWSTTGAGRIAIASLKNGEKIKILKDEDPYYLIETSTGSIQRGYCMKNFVIKST